MSMPVNPHNSPRFGSPLHQDPQAEHLEAARRPATPKVIGIISLTLATLSLIAQASWLWKMVYLPEEFQEAIVQGGLRREYLIAMWGLGVLMSFWLFGSGIGLLKYKLWGRIGFSFYAVLAILLALVGAFMAGTQSYASPPGEINTMENELVMIRRTTAVVINLMGMLFPVLGMIFLNRSRVAASLK